MSDRDPTAPVPMRCTVDPDGSVHVNDADVRDLLDDAARLRSSADEDEQTPEDLAAGRALREARQRTEARIAARRQANS
jgi:hypothetical protein